MTTPSQQLPGTPYAGDAVAILIADSWSSSCSKCEQDADPKEERHSTVLGYGGATAGCGARFVAIASSMIGEDVKTLTKALRPDLPYLAIYPGQ